MSLLVLVTILIGVHAGNSEGGLQAEVEFLQKYEISQMQAFQNRCADGQSNLVVETSRYFCCNGLTGANFNVQALFQSVNNDNYAFQVAYAETAQTSCTLVGLTIVKEWSYHDNFNHSVNHNVLAVPLRTYSGIIAFINNNVNGQPAQIRIWNDQIFDY